MRWFIWGVAAILAAVAVYVFVAPQFMGSTGVSVEKPGEATAPAVTPAPDAAPDRGGEPASGGVPAVAPPNSAAPTAPSGAAPDTAAQTEAAAEAAVAAAAKQAEAEAAVRAAAEAETKRIAAVLADPAAREAALTVQGFDAAVADAAIDGTEMAGPQKLALKNLLKASKADPALLDAALSQVRAALTEE